MDQNIGIVYGVSGHEKVMNAMTEMGNAGVKFQNTMNSAASSMNAAFSSMEQIVGRLTSQINGLKSAAQGLNKSSQQIQKTQSVASIAPPPIPSKTPHDIVSPRAASQAGLRPSAFMARWYGSWMAASSASHLAKDAFMGKSRAEIIEPLRDLGAVGFDAGQRKATEIAGQSFIRGMYANGGIKDYLGAVSEAGSALDINDPAFRGQGTAQLNKMAQAAMVLGATSQMKAQQATKTLMATVHSQLFQMKPEEQSEYDAGIKSVAGLAEQTAGKLSKLVQITSIWGPEAQQFLNYALPTALGKGWSIDEVLGLAGTLRTAGIPAAKAGRGLKSILEGEMGKYAAVQIAGHDDPRVYSAYKQLSGSDQKRARQSMIPILEAKMKADKFGFFEDLGKKLGRTEARGISLVEGLGLSKQWVGQTRMMSQAPFIEKWKANTGKIAATDNLADARAHIADIQSDSGWLGKRLENSYTAFTQSLGRNTPIGKTVESWMDGLDILTGYNNGSDKLNYKTTLNDIKDFGIHGMLFGSIQEVANFAESAGKMTGILPENMKIATVEELWSGLLGKIDGAYTGLQGFVNAASNGFDKLDAMLKPYAEGISGLFGKLNPLNWLRTPELVPGSIGGQPSDLMTPAHVRFRDNPGALQWPSQPPAPEMQSAHGPASEPHTIVVNPEVKVMLDGRSLQGAVIETLQENATRNRQTFGGGALGGLNLK